MRTFYCLLLSIAAVSAVDNAASVYSTLQCGTVPPGAPLLPATPVTCDVTALDANQQPTRPTPSTFHVNAVGPNGVDVSVSGITIRDTHVTFTVTANSAGAVFVSVTVDGSGAAIAGSGVRLQYLATPTRYFSEFLCARTSLPLRTSVNCSAKGFGANDLPAYVDAQDVEVTVASGQAVVTSGAERLLLTYTAPNTINGDEKVTMYVNTRQGGSGTYSATFALSFPSLPANENSKLECTGSGADIFCSVTALDALGPVRMDVQAFGVSFDPPYNSIMSAKWTPGGDARQARLVFEASRHDKVFSTRMNVFIASTAFHILGSPYSFDQGVAPTASSASVSSCDSIFIVPGGTTNCTIDVSPDVTADATYFEVSATSGSISPLWYFSTGTTHGLQFTFTAPNDVSSRKDIMVSVNIGGKVVRNSPRRFVVYAEKASSDIDPNDQYNGNYDTIVVVGSLAFFGIVAVAIIAVAVDRRRKYEARKHKGSTSPQAAAAGHH